MSLTLTPPPLLLAAQLGPRGFHISKDKQGVRVPFLHAGQEYHLGHGSVVIAAVISCTNNCNPSVMLTAGKPLSRSSVIGDTEAFFL